MVPKKDRQNRKFRKRASGRYPIEDAVLGEMRGAQSSSATASLTERAVSVIRDRILDLTLAPGLRIDERLLMENFQQSRTPAREAMNRLAAEGLIEIQSNKGAFVRALDIKELKQFFDAFIAGERMTGFFCNTRYPSLVASLRQIEKRYEKEVDNLAFMEVTKLNSAFHIAIAQATENEHIVHFCSRLHNQARRISHFIYRAEAYRSEFLLNLLQKFKAQHSDIIEAIARDNNTLLVDLLTEHAVLFHTRIVELIGSTTSPNFYPVAKLNK